MRLSLAKRQRVGREMAESKSGLFVMRNSPQIPLRAPAALPLTVIGLGILAVSTASLLIRFAQQDAGSLAIAAARLSLASLILIPLALWRNHSELRALPLRDLLLASASGALLALHFATWITSLAHTSVTSSIVLVSTLPLWVALVSPAFLKERADRAVWLGLGLASLGTIWIALLDVCSFSPSPSCPPLSEVLGGGAFLGDGLALAGAWAGAGYMLIGRGLRSRLSLLSYVTLVYSAAAVLLLVAAALAGQTLAGLPAQTYGWLVLLALIPQLLGHSSFNYALGHLPASFVSLTLLGEPIGTILLAFLFLGELPGAARVVGAILILAGIAIAARTGSNVKPPDQPDAGARHATHG
jgi:drug/metabolite transporter (DMT)-like permease